MISFALAFMGGGLASAWIGVSPAELLAVPAWLGAAVLRFPAAERALRCVAGAGLGLFFAARAMLPPPDCRLPQPGRAQKIWLEARIDDYVTVFPDSWRAPVTADAADRAGGRVCGTVLLSVAGPSPPPAVGARIRVHAHLRRPTDFANPGAPARAADLARKGVWATASAVEAGVSVIAPPAGGSGVRIAEERRRIGRLIDAALPREEAGLLRALVVGDTSGVTPELRDGLARAGIIHFLSISGLHIAVVWGLVFFGTRALLSRSERLLLATDVRAIAAVGAVPPATFYAALAGGSVPTLRSIVMVTLPIVATVCGREIQPLRTLVLTALGIAAGEPGAVLDPSFQLSFASVAALLLAAPRATAAPDPLRHRGGVAAVLDRLRVALLLSAAVMIGTAPLVAFHFNRLSPVGLVTNPLLVPSLGAPATVLGLVGAALSYASEGAAGAAFRLAWAPLAALRHGVGWSIAPPFASVHVPTPTLLEIGLVYALIALAWSPAPRRRVLVAALALAVSADVAFWTQQRFLHRDLRIRFLDVGQGDAAVIELPGGRTVVVDGGGFARSRFDVGERVVARYLRTRKIMTVDVLVATHGDFDHQGGLHYLARELSPRELWIGGQPREAERLARLRAEVAAAGGTVHRWRRGETRSESGVTFECLHPPSAPDLGANDSSLVLRIAFGGFSAILPGDLEAGGEATMMAAFALAPADVLKVPHHGSATSSSAALVLRLRPRVAVVSLGAENPFGFPNPAVIARYAGVSSVIYRTDRDGSVAVATDGRRFSARPFARASPFACSAAGVLC